MRLEGFFPYRLALVAEAFSRQLVAVYGREYGLSREEWRLLFLLAEAGGLDSLSLAARSSLDKVQISRAAGRLADKGLILRSIPGNDRRLRRYEITAAGRTLFSRAFAGVEARAAQVLDAMSETDRAALSRGLDALSRAVEQAQAAEAR